MNNQDLLVLQKGVDAINVLTTSSPETNVVQTDAALHEPLIRMLFVARPNAHGGPTAHIIEAFLSTKNLFQSQEWQ
jgi:hypothetical protein